MDLRIVMADPAGNRTAIVRSLVPAAQRAKTAALILADKELRAEQVGFETEPLWDGAAGRLEMMGGEFCGNAARSYGYLLWSESIGKEASGTGGVEIPVELSSGQKELSGGLLIEISGAKGPLRVSCHMRGGVGSSYVSMPLPKRLELSEEGYPLVISEGIAHLILVDAVPDEGLVERLVRRFGDRYPAFGVQFVQGGRLIPVVYVAEAGSLVWESSCGSGSLAAAWYLEQAGRGAGSGLWTFEEPGGAISVRLSKDGNGLVFAEMGGGISLEKEAVFRIDL